MKRIQRTATTANVARSLAKATSTVAKATRNLSRVTHEKVKTACRSTCRSTGDSRRETRLATARPRHRLQRRTRPGTRRQQTERARGPLAWTVQACLAACGPHGASDGVQGRGARRRPAACDLACAARRRGVPPPRAASPSDEAPTASRECEGGRSGGEGARPTEASGEGRLARVGEWVGA
eukprot:1088038-Pleurochrysis_carterae.AAC.1